MDHKVKIDRSDEKESTKRLASVTRIHKMLMKGTKITKSIKPTTTRSRRPRR